MSKAVLISIRPKWCQKIADGEKTIEVRKTRPKLKTPFRCYIYCTLPKYPHEDYITTEHPLPQFYGGGKIIGEFVCDRIDRLVRVGVGGSNEPARYCVSCADGTVRPVDGICENACLPREELELYLGGREGYGLHVSKMKLYDDPKELSEFRKACAHDWYCDSCAMYWENSGTCGNESLRFRRPPLSWMYVEEGATDNER